jgi:hypothetical protein
MSNEINDELEEKLKRIAELDRRKKEFQEKDLTLKEHKVGRELDELIRNMSELEQAKGVAFGRMSAANIAQLVLDNDEYMEAAKHAMVFLNESFKKILPYFRKNLIVIGGDTGDGKSTSVANIIFNTITRKNPATGKLGRVLVLSNEEAPEDFYNRVTCLLKGWRYANHDQFSDEQRSTFREYIPIWAAGGRLTIIGDYYEGVPGWTTSVEGIETIFNNLLKDHEEGKEVYDVIIIDYYQNVRYSKVDPKLDEYGCQRKLSGLLDQMKLRYPGPIVVMAQMKRLVDDDDSTPFNVRLKGSKLICDKATFICELIPKRKLLMSVWKIWKSRFTEAVGESVETGYDRGMFVPYSVDFQTKVSSIVNRNLEKDKEEELGIRREEEEDE